MTDCKEAFMVIPRRWAVGAIGASLALSSLPARAEAPGLYYAWRSLDGDITVCLDRATGALNREAVTNIQVEGNSVAGTTADASAVFVCLDGNPSTTVMIMVASNNDAIAFELREALKVAF
jgi:hypothetical protein